MSFVLGLLTKLIGSKLSGFKTYIVAAGMIGLAVYQFSIGDYEAAAKTLLEGLGAITVRLAIAKGG